MFVTLVEMITGEIETGAETEIEIGGETGPGHVIERDAAEVVTGDVTEAEIDAGVAAETGREARDHAAVVVIERGDVKRERKENLMEMSSESKRSQLTLVIMISTIIRGLM